MIEEAEAYLGAEMERTIRQYRERLAETPVELEVREKPSVNVHQEESWIDLRLRYLVHPRRGQRVKNELYTRILARVNYPTLLARHSSDSLLEGGASCVNDGTCRNHVSRRARA